MRKKLLFPITFLIFGFAILWAQVNPEGKKISSIKIEVIGPNTVGKSFVLQNLQVENGGEYEGSAIDRSIRNLTSSGTINDVRVFIDQDLSSENEIALIFKVWTKSRIKSVLFEGNDKLSERSLEKIITLNAGDLMDEATLKSDLSLLKERYLEKGYWNSIIDSQIIRDGKSENVSILYKIVEGDKRTISKILFAGNKSIPASDLLDDIETAPWRFWRFWSKRSKYRPEILEEDLEKLRAYYRNKGFLDVKIDQSGVLLKTVGKNKLVLTITVQEGDRSFFGKQSIVGNVSINTDELLFLKKHESGIEQGEPYSPELLREETTRLRKKYGEKGYLDARVIVNRRPNLETKQIDLRFEITENNKFTVNSIEVRGNDKTKTIAIVRELALSPGDTFDLVRMETSEARLRNTRFFEKVSLDDQPIQTNDPELQKSKRNLVVDVEEGRTGHVSFGVGFSTLEKAMMFAEFRQGNFDIMKWRSPHRLQGDGQKFRLRLKLGSRSNEARLALEEPWFLNRRIAAGFEVFREKSDYYSSYYDEMRAGFEIYFRKRLFELVEGRAFYGYEDVLIDDIDPNSPFFIRKDANSDGEIKKVISKVGLTLSRDTRDSILFPSEGSILSLRKELAGGIFGGDADYGRLEIQGARFIQTFRPMEQILSFSGRTGTLGRLNGKKADVPFFERFFLGGPYNLRGWDYRDAGVDPLQGEPEGGNSYTYASLEYTFKVADPLRLALFYDGGYLRSGDFKLLPGDDHEGWHDNWGFGLRIMVMGMPLRLDLGVPISDPSETGGSPQFHFSGGSRF